MVLLDGTVVNVALRTVGKDLDASLAAVTVAVTLAFVPESRTTEQGRYDGLGAGLAAVALAGITYWLIEWGTGAALPALGIGLGTGAAFLLVERRVEHPMLPLGLFGSRTFSAANAM